MNQKGFTLIEVLVALSIASVGLISLVKAQITFLNLTLLTPGKREFLYASIVLKEIGI